MMKKSSCHANIPNLNAFTSWLETLYNTGYVASMTCNLNMKNGLRLAVDICTLLVQLKISKKIQNIGPFLLSKTDEE